MPSLRFYGVKLAEMIVTLWVIVTAIFLLFRLMPGSYTDILVFSGASQATADALIAKWGLNDPFYVQYGRFMWNYLTLNPGTSFQTREPLLEMLLPRMWNSFILVAPGITLAYILGAGVGTIAGGNRGSRLDEWGMLPFVLVGTIPSFFTSILLIIVFAVGLGWFPTSGIGGVGLANPLNPAFPWHYTLPFTAVVMRYLWYPTLVMRTSVVEVMGQPFIKYHEISGLPQRTVWQNIAKHASLPVITLYPISMIKALSGLVLIEMVFNWPGIGFTLVEAVFQRDFPVLQFVFVILAVYIVIANFIVDLLYARIDPRVTLE
jgi:peptide/nickel transport system permease protein